MNKYLITNTISGVELGAYEGAAAAEALDAMARDAGYSDYAECCEVAPASNGEIAVTQVARKWEIANDPRINGYNVEFLGAQRPRAGQDY